MSSGALVVLGKLPSAGLVKTRLCPPLSLTEAADFYREMLTDVLEASAAAALALDLDCVLTLHPPSALAEIAASVPIPARFRIEAQQGEDLSERMTVAMARAFAAGHRRVLLRASDSPTIGEALLREALASLDDCDLVFSPDQGGGYGLVGLRCPAPGLFDHPMSTVSVLDDTRAAADGLGLRSTLLSPTFDLDVAEDFAALERARDRGDTKICRRTLAWIDDRGLWSRLRGETEPA